MAGSTQRLANKLRDAGKGYKRAMGADELAAETADMQGTLQRAREALELDDLEFQALKDRDMEIAMGAVETADGLVAETRKVSDLLAEIDAEDAFAAALGVCKP